MKTVDEIELLRSFVVLADVGELQPASRLLHVSRSGISRRIKTIESKLGKDLFNRDQDGFRLTESGYPLYKRAKILLSEFEDLNSISEEDSQSEGCLYISAPNAIGNGLLIPWIKEFMAQHPNLMVDLTLTLGPIRLLSSNCDVRINHGFFPCEKVISRPLGSMVRMMVASPEYLSKNGSVNTPQDLAHHCLLAGNDLLGKNKLILYRNGETVTVPYLPKLHLKDHVAARTAALSHIGIAVHAFRYDTLPYVASGRLIEVLPDWEPEVSPVSILLPASRPPKSISMEFVDFVTRKWHNHPHLSSYNL